MILYICEIVIFTKMTLVEITTDHVDYKTKEYLLLNAECLFSLALNIWHRWEYNFFGV